MWPAEAAEVQYLIGNSQMEIRHYVDALEAYNQAVFINPKYAEVSGFWCFLSRWSIHLSIYPLGIVFRTPKE